MNLTSFFFFRSLFCASIILAWNDMSSCTSCAIDTVGPV